ncbi:RNB domain-containing ribonuclease [Streptacidiphilus sp. EB103A]|uniref:RNB domain-containing ribonuclease n=1 Tax=Streptacidiphilus sp. EB103A TaxID=3156275 RepID=UPI00351727AA
MPDYAPAIPLETAFAAPAPVMIDHEGTLDRDDALAVRRLVDGWELTVDVADVAAGVAPGGAVDEEAFQRRQSAYGGIRGTAKMLPRPVEEQLTLAEDRPCPAMRVRVSFDRAATATGVLVERATMNGAVAMDHAAVAAAVADPVHPLHSELRDAAELSEALLARRRDQGALALYDLLKGWATDEDGQLVRLALAERNIGYKIVQECMIAANTALAGWAAERDLPLLFRNHSAAKVAPPRESLLHDLDVAMSENSPARLQALQERTLLVVRAAEYAPVMSGHWGLNLAGYVHATSPLRRYADLVVQRVVLSHLDGTPGPYTDTELAQIAQSLNEGARAEREARNASLKSSAHTRARREASTDRDYSGLNSRDFHALLKRSCKENIANDHLMQETARRAAGQQLTSLELQLVLLVASSTDWEPTRTQCLAAIAATPETAVSVLATHAQINNLALPTFTDRSRGPAHNPMFTSRAELVVAGEAASGQERSAPAKKPARQQAALSLLAGLAGLPDPSADQVLPDASAAMTAKRAVVPAEAEGRQPVMVLNEYTQFHVISDLRFDFAGEGPSHQPTFTCSAHAVHRGESLRGHGSASAKAGSKTAAAADLLQQVHARIADHGAD